jgi:hypothetical protein
MTGGPGAIGGTCVWEKDPWRGGAVRLSCGGMWRGVVVGLSKHDDAMTLLPFLALVFASLACHHPPLPLY